MVMGFVIGVGTDVYLHLELRCYWKPSSTRKGYYLSIHEMSASMPFHRASAVALLANGPIGAVLYSMVHRRVDRDLNFLFMQDKGEVPRVEKRVASLYLSI